MRPVSGEIIYWYNKPVGINGPLDAGQNIQYIKREDVTTAIDNLRNYEHGVHWDLPRNIDLIRDKYCFRWDGNKVPEKYPGAMINMYSPVNYACAPFNIGCGRVFCDQYRMGENYDVEIIGDVSWDVNSKGVVRGVKFVTINIEPSYGYLIPCLRYYVGW